MGKGDGAPLMLRRRARRERALELAENTLAAAIGAAAGTAGVDPALATTTAVAGVGFAAVVRHEVTRALDEIRAIRSEDFLTAVSEESAMEDAELMNKIRNRHDVALIVEEGLVAAMHSDSAAKRRLLARVVAAALRAPDDAKIDELAVLARTVDAVDPLHLRMLVQLGTPKAGQGRCARTTLAGAMPLEELEELMPHEQRHLAGPILAVLERESLARDPNIGAEWITDVWAITEYGRRFLQFLAEDDLPELDLVEYAAALSSAEVVCFYEASSSVSLTLKNLGPGEATVVSVHAVADGASLLGDFDPPIVLRPGELSVIGARRAAANSRVDMAVKWRDSRGRSGRFEDSRSTDEAGRVDNRAP